MTYETAINKIVASQIALNLYPTNDEKAVTFNNGMIAGMITMTVDMFGKNEMEVRREISRRIKTEGK